MNARDRVKLCIEQARSHSGETALGSVINAVEILAGELKDEPAEQTKPQASPHETHIGLIESNDGKTAICVDGGRFDGWILYKHVDGQWVSLRKATPSEMDEARTLRANKVTPPASPPTPPNLVERLTKAYVFAEMEAIAGGGDPVDMGVRAILASLSKTPVAMMTADHIATLCGGDDYSPMDRRYARVAVQAFQEFVAPILAAKDNRIQELETRVAAVTRQRDDEHGLSNLRSYEIDTWKKELADARAKIAGLERQREAEADFPTDDDIANRVDTPNECCIDAVLQTIAICREHHAAVVAAKDPKLAKLEKKLAREVDIRRDQEKLANEQIDRAEEACNRVSDLKQQLATAKEAEREQRECVAALSESLLVMPGRTLVEAVKDLIELHKHAKKRVDELANVTSRQVETVKIESARAAYLEQRAAELETRIADLTTPVAANTSDHLDKPVSGSLDLLAYKLVPTFEKAYNAGPNDQVASVQAGLRAVFAACFVELTTPPTVDGKTPGQVFGEAFRNGFGKRVVPNPDSELVRTRGGDLVRDYQREQELDWANAMEIGAQAVLRAFGNQPGQTPTTNAVEVLRDLKSKLPVAGMYLYAESVQTAWLCALIDDKIALLGGAKSAPTNEFPTFVASKDVIRGSYFCTEFPFRPYLHVGRDIEFDDIPRLLNLGRSDVIEIRVVQRAKQ